MLILESFDHAEKRGANILAELVAYGYSSDGFHLVRPEDSGSGQIRSMKMAISMASVESNQIDHVNVHATSTMAGDEIEARSLKEVFGSHS